MGGVVVKGRRKPYRNVYGFVPESVTRDPGIRSCRWYGVDGRRGEGRSLGTADESPPLWINHQVRWPLSQGLARHVRSTAHQVSRDLAVLDQRIITVRAVARHRWHRFHPRFIPTGTPIVISKTIKPPPHVLANCHRIRIQGRGTQGDRCGITHFLLLRLVQQIARTGGRAIDTTHSILSIS